MAKAIALVPDGSFFESPPFDELTAATVLEGEDRDTFLEAVQLPVGSDGQVLTCDSSQPAGVKWAAPSGGGGGGTLPAGSIIDFGGASPPVGWLACDGSAVSRATYSDLFAAIGTSWGNGDGSTTFNLPDLRGRTTIGDGTGSSLTARSLGQTGGAETHQLTVSELPNHTHGGVTVLQGVGLLTLRDGPDHDGTDDGSTGGVGSDEPHNNMPPFGVVRKIIKA